MKYETCNYAEDIGIRAVYVKPGCPKAAEIKGRLVTHKKFCEECQFHKQKEDNHGNQNND